MPKGCFGSNAEVRAEALRWPPIAGFRLVADAGPPALGRSWFATPDEIDGISCKDGYGGLVLVGFLAPTAPYHQGAKPHSPSA